MKNLLFASGIAAIGLFVGCDKKEDASPMGQYSGEFASSYTRNGENQFHYRTHSVQLVSADQSHISLSIDNRESISSVLSRNDKLFSGVLTVNGTGNIPGGPLGPFQDYGSPQINVVGIWDVKDDRYCLSGHHQYIYYYSNGTGSYSEYIATGEFELLGPAK